MSSELASKALREILTRHGVKEDAHTFLERKGRDAGISTSPDPDVQIRGTVQLMKDLTIDRETVDKGLKKLKHL
jgi:hypothetical protein